jgi:hypothetical protein
LGALKVGFWDLITEFAGELMAVCFVEKPLDGKLLVVD